MARHRKGTTDHDGDGAMGGSLSRVDVLERQVAILIAVIKRNGITLPKDILE